MEENDEEATERARVRPALTISDMATRFNKHVASGRHGVELRFGENEWPVFLSYTKLSGSTFFNERAV